MHAPNTDVAVYIPPNGAPNPPDLLTRGALLPHWRIGSQESDGHVQEALARVRKRVGDLGWAIIEERLSQDKPTTLEELGRRYGVSRERVRQVELKTKAFLARYLYAFNEDQEIETNAAA